LACASKINAPVTQALLPLRFCGRNRLVPAGPRSQKPHSEESLPCLNVVEALDAEDTGNFADIGSDAFELLAVADFQGEINAGM
jgi:hypothetical protein